MAPYIFQFFALITSTANMIFLIVIIYSYWGKYREIKSKFTLILIFLFLLFMIQNFLFTVYFLLHQSKSFNGTIMPLLFLGFEFIVLILFLKVSPE